MFKNNWHCEKGPADSAADGLIKLFIDIRDFRYKVHNILL